MSTTIYTNLQYNAITSIFDNKQFYVKIFKDLLNAATTNDFTELSRTSTEIKNTYNTIHNKVLDFFKDHIYEKLYTSDAYDALMYALVDIYSVMYTIVDMRGNITNFDIQPDQVIDAYLDSFGFPAKELFNYIQKREICKVVYWYLRRKGTPQLIIKLLNTLGFSYFFISEFQLCETEGISTNSHQYTSRLIHEENDNGANSIGFYFDTSYTYDEVKEFDPLNIQSDEELSNNDLVSFPSQSSYYQMGIAVTYPELERKISSFSYAMIKKTYYEQEIGEDVFTSKVTDYNKKASFISLILGYTYIMGEYFGIYDNVLFEKIKVEDYYDEDTFDPENITTKLYTKTGTDYDLESYFDYNFDGTKVDYNEDAYINTTPVVGWNKDIYNSTPLEIMRDIDYEIRRLSKLLKYQPDIERQRAVSETNSEVETYYDNIYLRKKNNLKEIKDIFYSAPIFISYENAIEKFIEHDKNFKNHIDSILLTEEKRIELKDDEVELERHLDQVLELLNNILESIEYYIFDNTTYIIPVKNFIISYSRTLELLKKIDEHFTPYHSKLLYPLVTWMIKDLPGDIVAISDSIIKNQSVDKIYEPYWIADGYEIYDAQLPNPYTPMYDWKNKDNGNPHIPISLNYLDEPIYDRWEYQKNNPFLFTVGYDWRHLLEKPLIVQNREYKLKYDWEPDLIKLDSRSVCTSGFNISKPDQERIKLIEEINQYIESKKVYIKTFKTTLQINPDIRTYVIHHNFYTKEIFVQAYDIDTGEDVYVSVYAITFTNIQLNIKSNKERQIKVIIITPTSNSYQNDGICGLSFNIFNNSYHINNYLLYTYNEYLNDCFCEIYDKNIGFKYNVKFRRNKDKKSIYLSHNKYDNNLYNQYRVNLFGVIENKDINKVHINQTVFTSYQVDLSSLDESYVILDHKFRTNNLLIRIYDIDKNYEEVHPLIEYLNINQIRVDFSEYIESGRYSILILATLNNLNIIALPINDITGFSASFKLKENITQYNVNHNLNSYNTFEQIYDKETGQLVNINVDRIDQNNIKLTFNNEYVNQNINKEYSLIIFGEVDIDSIEYPSTIYNTKFETCIVKNKKDAPIVLNYDQISDDFKIEYDTGYETMIYDSDYDSRQTVYHIEHNMNNENIVLQIYDDHNLKVDSYVQIVDKNNIILVVNKALILDEKYKINILALPEENVAPSNYNLAKKSNNFISMYTEILSNDNLSNDYFEEEIDNGDESLTDEDFEEDLDGGDEESLDSEYLDDYNNGDPSTGTNDSDVNTFTINHNLNTKTVLVNVFNNITKETVNTYVAINDENSITIGFLESFNNSTDDYCVVVIGALPFNNIDMKLYYDRDSNNLLQPHHYMEYKTYEDDTMSKHISLDNDFYDMNDEYITSSIKSTAQINIHKRDLPTMRERVDIIHKIKIDDNNIATIKEDVNERYGFNEYSILTNDISSDNNIREDTGYKDTLTHIMKVEPLFL